MLVPNLNSQLGEVQLDGFVIAASGSMTQEAPRIISLLQNGCAAVVTKTVAPPGCESVDPPSNWVAGPSKVGAASGGHSWNCQGVSRYPLERNLEIYRRVHEAVPGAKLIGSVLGSARSMQSWSDVMEPMADLVVAYELNVSCPQNVIEYDDPMGAAIGSDPDRMQTVVAEVAKIAARLGKFFSVKLTPNVTDPVSLARCAAEAGAPGLTGFNTHRAFLGFDPHSGAPFPAHTAHKSMGTNGALSGHSIHPIALELTRQVLSNLRTDFPDLVFMGSGGVEDGQTANNFIMLGAHAVQVYSALAAPEGQDVAKTISQQMGEYMSERGDTSLDDFRGRGLQSVVPSTQLVGIAGGYNANGRFQPEG